jgi:hypothetical protein
MIRIFMKLEKINFMLLIVIVVGLLYVAFYQPIQQRARLKWCFNTAVGFEKARHWPVDDLTVTNQDISSFQKNLLACLAE